MKIVETAIFIFNYFQIENEHAIRSLLTATGKLKMNEYEYESGFSYSIYPLIWGFFPIK